MVVGICPLVRLLIFFTDEKMDKKNTKCQNIVVMSLVVTYCYAFFF